MLFKKYCNKGQHQDLDNFLEHIITKFSDEDEPEDFFVAKMILNEQANSLHVYIEKGSSSTSSPMALGIRAEVIYTNQNIFKNT